MTGIRKSLLRCSIRTLLFILLLLLINGCGGEMHTASDPAESRVSGVESPSPDVAPSDEDSASSESEPDGNARQAKEAVSRFMAAIKATDIDALTQLTDVPFLLGGKVIAKPQRTEELPPEHFFVATFHPRVAYQTIPRFSD